MLDHPTLKTPTQNIFKWFSNYVSIGAKNPWFKSLHVPLDFRIDVNFWPFFSLFQDQVQARDPPSVYLSKLRLYLDPNGAKSSRSFKKLDSSTQVLKDLEISLRTNNIEWVREFLSTECNGLETLIEYLTSRLFLLRHKLEVEKENQNATTSKHDDWTISNGTNTGSSTKSNNHKTSILGSMSLKSKNSDKNDYFDGPRMNKLLRQSKNKNIKWGDTTDDIHVCIMCLRAIMNNKFGFNMVIGNEQAINCIALSLVSPFLQSFGY